MNSPTVWVVDDDRSIRWVLEKALQGAGLEFTVFDSAKAVRKALEARTPAVVMTDIRMPEEDGLSLLEHLHTVSPKLPVIVMTAHSDLDSAVASYKKGAFEYLPKPFDVDDAISLVRRALERQKETPSINERQVGDETPLILGEAPAMQDVFRAIGRLAQAEITVLINGESGTGKELVAKALHANSPRKAGPFIALNMAAIPKDLVESELFGHEKGSFTGATGARIGRFEQANAGTLFLDEIGDMPFDTQTRLLRVLADNEFYRVGGISPVKVNVRIVAATHQNLEERVLEGSFREDLFHRLNVIRIKLPALRDRREDVPGLAEHFLAVAAREINTDPKHLGDDAKRSLSDFNWPGNVRQLENMCRWLSVMAPNPQIQAQDLPPEITSPTNSMPRNTLTWTGLLRERAGSLLKSHEGEVIPKLTEEFERTLIEVALTDTAGRKKEAAEKLGWGRNTLTRKLKELGFTDSNSSTD
ncbi:MAG: nitrogen regulation protein NR(I) [Gammaproteobacteria bacterium]|nr:nitrogen regulation protein NR(I) [Gammaproteobacteria bacterium]